MSDADLSAPKKQKNAVEDDQNELEVAGPSNRQQPPSPPSDPRIFMLTADCCDEIFEYLSLEDLHSFGQTCKTFNKVAGEYFEQNYSAKRFYIDGRGPNTNPHSEMYFERAYRANIPSRCHYPGFNQYIAKAFCFQSGAIRYLTQHADEFTTMKSLRCGMKLHPVIQKLLTNIEHLNTAIAFVPTNLSKMSPSLKSLDMTLPGPKQITHDRKWLRQIFPNLVQLKCYRMPPVNQLNEFIERSPSVRSISLRFEEMLLNKNHILSSTIKLDWLEVNCFFMKESKAFSQIELLNEMYEHGFYKRLHIRIIKFDQILSDKLLTIQGLEWLEIVDLSQIFSLSQMTQLRRLDIHDSYPNPNETEILANGLVNLKHISVRCKSFDSNILPFIRRARNLCKIMMVPRDEEKVLNLSMLNEEREKLAGARKVTIYVHDEVYLATKWATKHGNTNLSLVEMRRAHSIEWNDL